MYYIRDLLCCIHSTGQLTELSKQHEEFKIRENAILFEDRQGNLILKDPDIKIRYCLRVKASGGQLQVERVHEEFIDDERYLIHIRSDTPYHVN